MPPKGESERSELTPCIYNYNTCLKAAVLGVLKQAARLNKKVLIEQTEAVKHKHRCTRLVEIL